MIYFIEINGAIKIGYTTKRSAKNRFGQYQTHSPNPIDILGVMPGTLEQEKGLHYRFSQHSVRGEWFRPAPSILDFIERFTVASVAELSHDEIDKLAEEKQLSLFDMITFEQPKYNYADWITRIDAILDIA